MVAPARAAPVASVTVPEIDATVCAKVVLAIPNIAEITAIVAAAANAFSFQKPLVLFANLIPTFILPLFSFAGPFAATSKNRL